MRHIGIFGGSFNPVHAGHMMVASYIAQWSDLDEVWLMLSPLNPLKSEDGMLPDVIRLDMLRLAAGESDMVKISDFELSMPRPSYTVDTMRALRRAYPDCHFRLIIGSDNWMVFDRWREPDELLRDYGVIIYPRPGYPVTDSLPAGAEVVDAPVCSLSSTMIRRAVADGRDVTFFLPHGVYDYIRHNRLYDYKGN